MTDMITAEALDWESMFNKSAQDTITDLPEIYYADPDDDPLAHLSPSMTFIKFDGGDGTFSDGEEELGKELDAIILDIARTRDLWTPQEREKMFDELGSFPQGRPICRNNDVDNEKPRLSQDLDEEQIKILRSLGAGNCETCELTKSGCRGGRKLLMFNPRWSEPVILQIHGTSIGGLNQMLRQDFKQKGRSIGIFSRPVKLSAKKCESKDAAGKKITYYQLQGKAYGYLEPDQVKIFMAMRDMYPIRNRNSQPQLPESAATSAAPDPADEGRLI